VLPRDPGQRDILLYLPDAMLIVDQDKRDAWTIQYDFAYAGRSTAGLPRSGTAVPYVPAAAAPARDTPAGQYARKVSVAREEFKVGNLFEAVLSQTFTAPCKPPPSEVFRRLRRRNPSPYGFLINLGLKAGAAGAAAVPEYLVGASPEMFVRCEATKRGVRVETCPISGTIARGANALEDAAAVRALLASSKEESELTMCTDVDRNDKSRICEPGKVHGTVQVLLTLLFSSTFALVSGS
jgi:anthranilate synthase